MGTTVLRRVWNAFLDSCRFLWLLESGSWLLSIVTMIAEIDRSSIPVIVIPAIFTIVLLVFPYARYDRWLLFSAIVTIKWQLAFRRPVPRLTVTEKRVKSMKQITFFFRKSDAKYWPTDWTSSWFGFLWFLSFMFWVVFLFYNVPFVLSLAPILWAKGPLWSHSNKF